MTINEREENAYTLAVQAGLWGYPLAHRVEAFPRTLEAKGARAQQLPEVRPAEIRRGPVRRHAEQPDDRRVRPPRSRGRSRRHARPQAGRPNAGSSCRSAMPSTTSSSTSADRAHPCPAPYLITGPDYQGSVPGDMIQVSVPHQHRLRRPAHRGATAPADLAGALQAQEGFTMQATAGLPPTRHRARRSRLLAHRLPRTHGSRGPRPLRPPRVGDALHAAHPRRRQRHLRPDARHHRTQRPQGLRLARVGRVHAGRIAPRRPVIEQIADERWQTISETVNGWRGSLASGRCSFDWALNAANTKNQVGTEVADQVVYVNTAVDIDGPATRRHQQLRPVLRTRPDPAGRGHVEHRHV